MFELEMIKSDEMGFQLNNVAEIVGKVEPEHLARLLDRGYPPHYKTILMGFVQVYRNKHAGK
jgi:hypothetical protein